MPCTPDPVCDRVDTNTYSQENIAPTGVGAPYANMGWVGFARIVIPDLTTAQGNILRVNSANINLSQDITMPDVIDGRIDRTVYQLGPKLVEGTISMPVIADIETGGCPVKQDLQQGVAGVLLNNIWCWATARGRQGRMLYHDASFDIRYANHAAFKFDNCLCNTLGMSVTNGDLVSFDLNVIGRGRTPFVDPPNEEPSPSDFLSPARVLTWNDVSITAIQGCGNSEGLFYSNQVRAFSFEINNNADRFYTLQGSLFPMDINVRKREISGSVTLMGMAERLRILAQTNQDRFTEKNEIRMAFYIGEDTFQGGTFVSRDWTSLTAPSSSIFAKKFMGVVFQIEELALSNDVLESTVTWHALATDDNHYESIFEPTSCSYPQWQT
jgi:hypothetical protein